MEIILLERVAKLGQMGEVVNVKEGYARNYLLPQGKALRVNEANMARFEAEKAQMEARNLESKKDADALAAKLGVDRNSPHRARTGRCNRGGPAAARGPD